jgi:uncharacterized protein (DUF2062 family)
MITLAISLIIGFAIGFIPLVPFIGLHWSLCLLLSLIISVYYLCQTDEKEQRVN